MKKESKIVARVTHEQRLQYIALGGSKWLRRKLTDEAPESALAQKVKEVSDEHSQSGP